MIKVAVLLSVLAVASAKVNNNIVQQRQTDSDGSLGPESLPFLAPPPAPVPEPAGAGPDLDALYGPPKPYSFGYDAPGSDGKSSRTESSDGRKVTGSYTMVGADGINRIVNYVADGDGFRASIITNEPGTERQNPSGVIMETSQPKAEEIARQFGPVAEPGPDAPRQYIGAPIPAMPSFGSFAQRAPEVSSGSASPAFDSFPSQIKQEEDRFEQQQQQQQPIQQQQQQPIQQQQQQPIQQQQQQPIQQQQQQSLGPQQQLPQATKSFSQQIIHSVPAPTVQQQVAAPAFRPVQVQAPVQQQLFSDYQPVLVQEIPRVVPLPRPTLFVQQQQQPTFFPQPLPAPQPIPAPRPVVLAPAPLPTFNFQPVQQPQQPQQLQQQQPISSGSLSSGVKTAAASSSQGAIKSASSPSGAIKSRLVAPSRVAVRVLAPAPLPTLPAPQQPLFIQSQPAPTQNSFASAGNQGKTNLASASAPIKSAASSGKANNQRVLKPFYITSTQAPVRFEQSQQSLFNNQPESSRLSQVRDEQQKKDAESQEEQFFRS